MRLKIYSTLTILLFTISATAQVTLNKADLTPAYQDTIRMHAANYMAEGSSGADVSWDFSSLQSTGSALLEYVNPTNTIWKDSFSKMPVFASDNESLSFEFTGIDDDSMFLMANITDYDTDTVFQFWSNPAKLMVFPCTYNTGFTDDYYGKYDFLSIPDVESEGSITAIVDGWGTLKLPWGDINDVLRLKVIDDRTDTYDIGFGPESNHIVTTRYTWYAKGVAVQVLNLVSVSSSQGTSQAAAYIDEDSYKVSVQKYLEANLNLNIYPNPISSGQQLNISFNKDLNIKLDEVIVTDITGKVILDTEIDPNALGNINLDLYSLNSGLYFVTIKSGSASVTKKLTVY